jgi:hypothetical protein
LLVTEAKAALNLTMADFQLPALPGPEEEGSDGQGQDPLTLEAGQGIDQVSHGFAMFAVSMFEVGLAPYNNQKEGRVGSALA